MSRIYVTASATAALLISSSALAWSWEAGSRLTLVTSNGETVVGVGAVDDGKLAMTLSPGFSGFAVLVVEGSNGALSTFDVVVEADGSILIGDNGDFQDLRQSVSEAGFGLRIAAEAGGESGGGRGGAPTETASGDAAAEERTGGAAAGRERAGESVQERAANGLDRAQEAGGRGAEMAGRAGSKAGAEAERGVDVEGAGIGAGVGLPD
jgi:hypothetical protein